MQWRRQCSLHSKRFREVGKQRKTKEGVLPARKMGLEPKMKEGELGRGWKFAMIAFGPASTLVIFYTMVTDRFQPPLLSIRWERVAFFFCFVPLLSLVSCVSIALVWHFDETTKTHCNVSNSNALVMYCKLLSFFFARIFWELISQNARQTEKEKLIFCFFFV